MSTFEIDFPVRFGDCDPASIMFFPRYLDRLNETVEAWFSGPLGHSFQSLHQERGQSTPTAHLEVDFRHPSRMGEVLTYRLRVLQIGRSSVNLRVEAWCGEDLRARILQTVVYVQLDPMFSVAWPQDIRERMQAYMEAA